jgi:glycosyltransferase involved in cell wall biosynthesis
MIVDQLSTDFCGGAALAARRIHESVLAAGVQSRFCYSARARTAPPDSTYKPIAWPLTNGPRLSRCWARIGARVRRFQLKAQLKRALRGRAPGLELFSQPYMGWPTLYDPQQLSGDILHLHWISGFIDYASFFASVPDDHPLVWTLHDINPLSGGCHYPNACDKFTTGCGHCPQLGRNGARDLSRRFYQAKREALRNKNLHVVTPSRWLYREAQRSPLLNDAKSFHHIAYGLDVDVYAPRPKQKARRHLGLPREPVILGFGADLLGRTRKGLRQLQTALGMLQTKRPLLLLSFGEGLIESPAAGIESTALGYLRDPQRLATVYAAMDVFVMPSLEDNLPQTGLEAMACGTPVIAFDAGGIVDYVRPHETGLLASVGNAAELSRRIAWLIERPGDMHRMGCEARRVIERDYHQLRQGQAYVGLYGELLDSSRALSYSRKTYSLVSLRRNSWRLPSRISAR